MAVVIHPVKSPAHSGLQSNLLLSPATPALSFQGQEEPLLNHVAHFFAKLMQQWLLQLGGRIFT